MRKKILLNEKITNFRKYGLSIQAKFLYIFTTENFDVKMRPVEYPAYRPMIQRVEKQFGQLLRLAMNLPDYSYRFALLHRFKEYEKAVWIMPGGRRVKLIGRKFCLITALYFCKILFE